MAPPYVAGPRRAMISRTMQARLPPPPVDIGWIRRRRRPRVSERSRTQGALYAPSRVLSVGTTQGAFANPAAGLTFPTVDGVGTNWWIDVTVTDVDPASVSVDPFTVAVTAPRRAPLFAVFADWDRDGYFSPLADITDVIHDLTVERAAVGDLPDEVSLVEGTTIAQATTTLEGLYGTSTVCDVLAPYRADSPLYRTPVVTTPVTIYIGMITSTGPLYYQQLVGTIRAVKPDSGSRTVVLTVLDLAEGLRAPITLPTFGMNRDEYLTSNHKFFVNSQAVIDYIARKNGIYASTAPHPQAQISCTGHGWLVAEAGRSAVPRGLCAVIPQDTWWTSGPFDMLAIRGLWDGNSSYQEFFARDQYIPVPGYGVGMAAWMRIGTDMGHLAGDSRECFQLFPFLDNTAFIFVLRIYGDGKLGGFITTPLGDSGFVQPVATTTQWQYVALHFQHNFDGTTRITFRQNGITSFGDITTPAFTGPLAAKLQCTAWHFVDNSNFQCWFDPNPPVGAWPGETPLNQADIDVGLNNMTHLPDIVNADSWATIGEVAAAEYALVGFSETGRLFFTSRNTTTFQTGTVEETLTADRSLMDLTTEASGDSVRNVVTTETAAAFLDFDNIVFQSQVGAQFDTPPGTSVYNVTLPYGAIGTTTQQIPQIPNASWGATILWGYVAVDALNPGTEIFPAAVTVLFTMTGDRAASLTITNNTGFTIRFATTSGQPALRVQGWLLEATPVAVEYNGYQGSVDTYGPRLFPVGPSPWRQLLASMRPVALRLLADLAYPVPVIDQFTAIGNPARKVGDTVRLVDPTGQGTLRATIKKLSRSLSSKGLVDTLTVRPVGPPGTFILDDPELGILDDPTLWIAP